MDEEQLLLREGDLRRLMAEWRIDSGMKYEHDWKLKKMKVSAPIYQLRTLDVLFGRGLGRSMRPANVLVRKVIAVNRDYYCEVESEKQLAAKALLAFFEAKGLRFVQEDDRGGYVESPLHPVLRKIQQSLRDCSDKNVHASSDASMLKALAEIKKFTSKDGIPMQVGSANEASEPSRSEISRFVPSRSVSPVVVQKKTKSPSSSSTSPVDPYTRRIMEKIRAKRRILANIRVGDRLGIYWPMDEEYHPAVVVTVLRSRVRVHYDDGTRGDVELMRHEFILWKRAVKDSSSNSLSSRPVKSKIAKRIEQWTGKCLVPLDKGSAMGLKTEEGGPSVMQVAAGQLPETEESDIVMSERKPPPDAIDSPIPGNQGDSIPKGLSPERERHTCYEALPLNPQVTSDGSCDASFTPMATKTAVSQPSPVSVTCLVSLSSTE